MTPTVALRVYPPPWLMTRKAPQDDHLGAYVAKSVGGACFTRSRAHG